MHQPRRYITNTPTPQLHSDKQQISIGFIGYPNVGKSSIINTLRADKVCKTAPIPGETKVCCEDHPLATVFVNNIVLALRRSGSM